VQLETDPSLLVPKAKKALSTYGHQLVIGNLLDTRKKRVVLVQAEGDQQEIVMSEDELNSSREIEEKIVREVKERHQKFRQ